MFRACRLPKAVGVGKKRLMDDGADASPLLAYTPTAFSCGRRAAYALASQGGLSHRLLAAGARNAARQHHAHRVQWRLLSTGPDFPTNSPAVGVEMAATDALLAHAELRDALSANSARGHLWRMADAFVEDAGESFDIGTADELVERWQRATHVAETFYVDPRMRDVVTAAASTLPDEPLLPEDMPTSHGFVLIPGGVGQVDTFGRLIVINAVLWMTSGGKVDLLMLTDKYDRNDFYNNEAAEGGNPPADDLPRFMPSSLLGITLNQTLPTKQTFAATLPPNVHVEQREGLNGTYQLHILREDGTPAHEDDVPDLDFGEHPDPVSRWLVATWRLMQQSLATVREEEPTRQVKRQLQRRNQEAPRVSVIALRRKTHPTPGEREVEWTHRWIRRGHWRQQPYKENDQWVKRAIWIHPTICGPEDKPLLVRDRVYSLKR